MHFVLSTGMDLSQHAMKLDARTVCYGDTCQEYALNNIHVRSLGFSISQRIRDYWVAKNILILYHLAYFGISLLRLQEWDVLWYHRRMQAQHQKERNMTRRLSKASEIITKELASEYLKHRVKTNIRYINRFEKSLRNTNGSDLFMSRPDKRSSIPTGKDGCAFDNNQPAIFQSSFTGHSPTDNTPIHSGKLEKTILIAAGQLLKTV